MILQSLLGVLRSSRTLGFAAIAASIGFSSAVQADMIGIVSNTAASTEQLGTYTGSLNYEYSITLSSWSLVITLTNTSPVANGGLITGVIFNIDSSDANASATLVSGTHPFQNAAGQNGAPYGSPYDAGAALGGNWLGGGSPNAGIQVGATGSFTFKVSASDAASLTASSFLNGPFQYDFLVRFKGFNNGGSDKVPGVPTVPGPTFLSTIAIGLLMPTRRRRA